tara:strand:- start:1080 stop:1217 length:138 start_codon:yes stop_codon:yes gene_type:complete
MVLTRKPFKAKPTGGHTICAGASEAIKPRWWVRKDVLIKRGTCGL